MIHTQLLDDGTGRDPLETYNFGKAAKYLFRPCQTEDGSADEECDIQFVGNMEVPDSIVTSEQEQKALDEITNRGKALRSSE